MKRWIAAALVLVAAGLTAWALLGRKTAAKPQELSVLFTCDVRGRLVPCGCFTGQMGGLTRIASLVGKGAQADTLKVDVGDAIEGPADYDQIEYRYIQQAFAQMGYDALNVGHREAQFSATQLRELKAKSPVPMLSANLLDVGTRTPIFDPFRIVRRGPWRIALVGVMDSRSVGDALGEGLAVESMETVLSQLLPTLKPQADFIVLLAFANEAALSGLARQFYELDLILGGKVAQPSQQLVRENQSLIFGTTNESRALGALRLTLAAPGKVTAAQAEVQLVHEHIPQDAEIAALAASYRQEIRRTRLAIDDPATLQQDMVPGVKAAATFGGSEQCVTCHTSAFKTWQNSAHAHGWKTLTARDADADPNCIACHSVGFGTPSGYRREFKDTKLINIGCESCHGPGSQHVADRTAGIADRDHFRTLGAGDCRKCHHGEFSRPFDWEKFWPAVQHGLESAATGARKPAVERRIPPPF